MKFVPINGFNSDYITVKYGVPHGSVLTPVLFLIFMNDLNFAIKIWETFHFANDTYLLNIKDSIKKKSRKSNPMAIGKQISLNVAKTEVNIFRRKKKQLDFDLNLKLCGKNL